MERVLVTSPLPGRALEMLREAAEVDLHDSEEPLAPEELARRLPGAAALVSLLADRVDRTLLEKAGGLKIVANFAVGYDNVDLAAARELGVAVTNTPDVLTDATADLAFALLLAAARRLAEGDRVVRAGEFSGWRPNLCLGVDLTGRTLGVVGMGRIGQAVARRGRGFSMNIVYHNRSRLPEAVEAELGARRLPLEELLAESDFVSLNCPLTPETRHLLDARRLALMKPTAVLVNTSRGPVIDEAALVEALREGRLFAAGLDVYENEPALAPGLADLDNVVLAPHVGSATRATRARMAEMCAESVLDALAGRPIRRRVS